MSPESEPGTRKSRAEEPARGTYLGPCPESATDLRSLLAALRPLGDSGSLARHAAECPTCFARLRDLFLATAPDETDPIHRLVDGFNFALYRLAKAILGARQQNGTTGFCFDQSPAKVADAALDALDRLEALDEYSEGRTTRSGEATALQEMIRGAQQDHALDEGMAETLLRRSIAIGGRYGLDAANLLGFLRYSRGDFDGAEVLFTTVIERKATDRYERETQAHAMNNLTGVHLGRDDLKSAILWCERSLMLKERLGLDARTNYLNLLFFWVENGTAYGLDRARHYLRTLLLLDDGKQYLEETIARPAYESSLATFRRFGLHKEFPEISLPPEKRQKSLELKQSESQKEHGA